MDSDYCNTDNSSSTSSMDSEKPPVPAVMSAKPKQNMTRSYPRKHNIADLLKWPILEMLEPEFLRTILLAFVYDNQALVVTNDDKVYAVGKNSLGCSGGDKSRPDSYFHPREVTNLSQKGIMTFCYCKESTVIALGKDGKMYYSEGTVFIMVETIDKPPASNNFGYPGLKSPYFQTPVVVHSIACQQNQIFTLLENGEVYLWKRNLPSISLTSQKIFSYIHNSKFVCIETTHDACMALMMDGKVYAWHNDTPLFKSDKKLCKQYSFTEIRMPDGVKIEKIACGYNHTLALSDAGHVYTWGSNESGQLGYLFGTTLPSDAHSSDKPQQVSVSTMGRVLEIAATNYCEISVAATSCGKVFMWGDCGGVIVKTPLLVPYTSIHEVFAKFARVRIMHRPLSIDLQYGSSAIDSFASAFDDQDTSDLTIVVEGKPIHVHKAVLKITSDYFRRMFKTDWADNDKNVIEHEEFSYVVYKAYLNYLYTDKIDLPLRDTLELLLLANLYLDSRLQRLCEEAVINGISISNALHVLVAARRHCIEDLAEVSMGFILSHMGDVVKSEDFSSLDGELAKELLREAANKNIFKDGV